jgi:hypothetical protein
MEMLGIARFPRKGPTTVTRIGVPEVLLLFLLAIASAAGAYTQDMQLERDLSHSDPRALALFPAKGYDDGAAGFFRTHGLYVVPNSERAWCTDKHHGVLNPGCYVEFSIQGKGLRAADAHGVHCGNAGRWYRAPHSNHYFPTPGAFISNAMAKGEWNDVETALYGEPAADRLPARSCGIIEDRAPRQHDTAIHVE